MIRLVTALWLALALHVAGAAEIILVNMDGANEGLNAPMLRTSPGDNPGMTLGALRRNAVAYAAAILADRLQITVPIRIAINFESYYKRFRCNTLLAAGGTNYLVSNFPNAPRQDTLYPTALANQLANTRVDIRKDRRSDKIAPYTDINVTFNSTFDEPDCQNGINWYYGLDGNVPPKHVSFLTTAIHEMIHGLGFQSFVILDKDSRFGSVGQFLKSESGERLPDIYSFHIQDLSYPGIRYWPELSASERVQSMTHTGELVWAARGSSNTPNAVGGLSDGARSGQVLLYAPNPVQRGSSISHFSERVRPVQLMAPFNNAARVRDGLGLATCILADIGWDLDGLFCPDDGPVMDPKIDYASVRIVSANSGGGGGSGMGAGSSRSRGGGCTVSAVPTHDPTMPALVLMALGVLVWRWRYSS